MGALLILHITKLKGRQNLVMKLINLSEIFLGGTQGKYGLLELNCSLMCGFKNMGWLTISISVGGRPGSFYW